MEVLRGGEAELEDEDEEEDEEDEEVEVLADFALFDFLRRFF